MVYEEERNEYRASIRRLPNAANVQLPDMAVNTPSYVKGAVPPQGEQTENNEAAGLATVSTPSNGTATNGLPDFLRPIDTSVRTAEIGRTSAPALKVPEIPFNSLAPPTGDAGVTSENSESANAVNIVTPELPELKIGDRMKIPVSVSSSAAFRSAVLGINFDPSKIAIRDVLYGDIFGRRLEGNIALPFLNQNGKVFISFSPNETTASLTGVLAYIEVEALETGIPVIGFEKEVMNFLGADGKNFKVGF